MANEFEPLRSGFSPIEIQTPSLDTKVSRFDRDEFVTLFSAGKPGVRGSIKTSERLKFRPEFGRVKEDQIFIPTLLDVYELTSKLLNLGDTFLAATAASSQQAPQFNPLDPQVTS